MQHSTTLAVHLCINGDTYSLQETYLDGETLPRYEVGIRTRHGLYYSPWSTSLAYAHGEWLRLISEARRIYDVQSTEEIA